MAVAWNVKNLPSPPNLTYEVKVSQIDANGLISVCSEALSVLNNLETLHVEAAMLSRLIYRVKSKMRCDTGFKIMSKVNRGLLNYLSLNLVGIYKSFNPPPLDNGYNTMYAPSRQMLEWVLVRTQGFVRLFCQVMESCQTAAYYFKCRLHLGHVLDFGILSLAIVSRIWSFSKYLVLNACKWYEKLRPFLDVLKPVGLCWLPSSYEFPLDLKQWIDKDLLDDGIKQQRMRSRQNQHKIFDLIDLTSFDNSAEVMDLGSDSEVEVSKEQETISVEENDGVRNPQSIHARFSKVVEDVNQNITKEDVAQKSQFISLVEDLGEPVSPPSFPQLSSTPKVKVEKTKKKEKSKLSIDQQIKTMKTARDMKMFLKEEERLRNKHSKKSVTTGLDKLQWHMLQKVVTDNVRQLKSKTVVKGSDEYKRIVKRTRREILMRIQ